MRVMNATTVSLSMNLAQTQSICIDNLLKEKTRFICRDIKFLIHKAPVIIFQACDDAQRAVVQNTFRPVDYRATLTKSSHCMTCIFLLDMLSTRGTWEMNKYILVLKLKLIRIHLSM